MSKDQRPEHNSGPRRPSREAVDSAQWEWVCPFKKQRILKERLKRLIGYLKPYKLQLLAVLLTAIISTIFSIVSPKNNGESNNQII